MKKLVFTYVLAALAVLPACDKDSYPANTPGCIKSVIDANKNNADWGIKSVVEYTFQGRLVYTFVPVSEIADGTTEVVDGECVSVCQLGGITGKTECSGVPFQQQAVMKRVIWTR